MGFIEYSNTITLQQAHQDCFQGLPYTLGLSPKPLFRVQERTAILRLHSAGLPLAAGVDLERIASDCNGYTGADLAALCREAAMAALTAEVASTAAGD